MGSTEDRYERDMSVFKTLIDAAETYVINLDNYINRNVIPDDLGVEGSSTIQ